MTGRSGHAGAAAAQAALVTGASSGIGLAMVGELVARGYDVLAVAEDAEVETLPERHASARGRVRAARVDLATAAGADRLCRELDASGVPVSFAALNAGVTVGGRFWATDVADHLRLVDLNCRSMVQLAWHLLNDMVEAGAGQLLVMSSIAATAPGPYQATYAASKAFADTFARGLRHELRGSGVSITSVLPGPTDTAIFERGGMRDTRIATGRKDSPEAVASQAVRAALAGKRHVVTGRRVNRAQYVTGRLLSSRLTARIAARETRPGSGRP
jgi:uncharacterized protein